MNLSGLFRLGVQRRIWLFGTVVALVFGCAPKLEVPQPSPPIAIKIRPSNVEVADTPEAQACERECLQLKTSCVATCRVNAKGGAVDDAIRMVQKCMDGCADERDDCLRGCPGE